jgi:hypothetical protein
MNPGSGFGRIDRQLLDCVFIAQALNPASKALPIQ